MNRRMTSKQAGGVSANRLVMPIVVVLAILHVSIIALIMLISVSSSELSTNMRKSGVYTQEATSLLAGSSILSETASNYVLMPETEQGEVNAQPLMAYAQELAQPRRGADVLAKFQTYDVPEGVLARVEESAKCAGNMLEAQLHAIALMRTVYPLPEVSPLTSIPQVELTDEELAMSDAERVSAARLLVLGTTYGLNKQSVSTNVNAAVEELQAASAARAAQTGRRVGMLRAGLWGVTVTIILILIATFATLYRQILFPLGRFVKLIPDDKPLDENKGFREVRMVASAYNGVLKRRDALDDILRSAAETDALTNLPNRYSFEQYLLESGESGYSLAVVLFDINFLKATNDTQGHLAGDELIREAAACIASCFSDGKESSCYRFGGDEFAAVVKNCSPERISEMVERFEALEKQQGVSISVGYAYAEEIGETTFKQLLEEADRQMYIQKKSVHDRA